MNRPIVLLALLTSLASSAALAQKNVFEVVVGGKPVGKSTYTVKKNKNGFQMENRSVYRVSGQDGDQTDLFQYNPSYKYLTGTTTDHNSLAQISYVPSKAGDEITVSHFQGGGGDNNPIPAKPNTVVLLPFDAGAAQMALYYVKTNPVQGNLYNVLIPGGGGGGGGGGGRRGGGGGGGDQGGEGGGVTLPGATDMLWVEGKDLPATLDSKPVTVHSYELAYSRLRIIFYADADNTLMEAQVPALQATYARNGFKLEPREAATPAPVTK